ncbi:MAG: hypothetical protein FJZ87_03515 [Chloroflexi bacterium]|nr:hypothetical protein [Chloroflexota bacterium]
MRISYEHVISKPPEAVFPWIAEPDKAMTWQKDVKGGEVLVDTPEVVGTTFREVVEEDGNSLEMHGTITKYVVNEIIGFHLESKIHEFDVSYSLEELDGKTKFKIDANIRWKFPMNVISLLIGKRIKENLVKKLESETLELKKVCESK